MPIRDTIPASVVPAGFKTWAEAVSDAVDNIPGGGQFGVVAQQPGQALPPRPATTVVHWYSWSEPPASAQYIYDQWFQIPEPAAPETGVPDAFTAGQWSVADTGAGGTIAVTIAALPGANPAISNLEYRLGAGAAVSFAASTTGTYNVTGLTDGVAVNVQLRAVNAEGAGAWSDTKAVTPTLIVLDVPAAFTVGQWSVADAVAGGRLTVTVTESPLANPPIDDLQYRLDGGLAQSFGGYGPGTYNIDGLTDDTAYNVQIRASNTEGPGGWSDTKSASPTAPISSDNDLFTNFSEYTSGVQPSDWTTRYNPDNLIITVEDVVGATGGKALRWEGFGSIQRKAVTWDAADSLEGGINVELLFRFNRSSTESTSSRWGLRAIARAEGITTFSNQFLAGGVTWNSADGEPTSGGGGTLVNSLQAGNTTTNDPGTRRNLPQDTWCFQRVRFNGNLIYCKAWVDGDPEPEWQLTSEFVRDVTGWIGFYDHQPTGTNTNVHYVDWVAIAADGKTAQFPT